MRLLDDVTVLEVSQVIAGPVAGSQLGDLGANVIKVEPPSGEPAREFDPRLGDVSSYFAGVNRNKRYITIDLKTERGIELFEDFVRDADIVLENFRHDTMDRLGIGYDRLRKVNESLIYCSINGYRSTSQYADLPSFDGIVQAMGGTMSITGESDGPPARAGVPVGDLAAGMYAVQSILAALYARQRDGNGRFIEIPLLDATISLLTVRAGYSFATGKPYPRGNTHSSIAPWTVFETADSYLTVSVTSERLWSAFCTAIDRTDLIDDCRFATNGDRVKNADELYDILRPILREQTSSVWFERFRHVGAPGGPVYDTIEMWDDPYINDQQLAGSYENDSMKLLESPIIIDENRLPIWTPPRPVDADTETVLEEFGYTTADIDKLRSAGVIGS